MYHKKCENQYLSRKSAQGLKGDQKQSLKNIFLTNMMSGYAKCICMRTFNWSKHCTNFRIHVVIKWEGSVWPTWPIPLLFVLVKVAESKGKREKNFEVNSNSCTKTCRILKWLQLTYNTILNWTAYRSLVWQRLGVPSDDTTLSSLTHQYDLFLWNWINSENPLVSYHL